MAEADEVEGVAVGAVGVRVDADDGDDESNFAEAGVEEELDGGAIFFGSAPDGDKQEEGKAGEEEEEAEEDEVEGDQGADEAGDEEEEEGVVEFY